MTNPLKQPNSWADRKLIELKAAGQNPNKPYVFLTSCVGLSTDDDVAALQVMVDRAQEVHFEEMSFNCDLTKFAEVMGYEDNGLMLAKDQMVFYHRSTFKDVPCYFLVHSAIEYIWVNARSWKAEKVLTALEAAGVEVDVP